MKSFLVCPDARSVQVLVAAISEPDIHLYVRSTMTWNQHAKPSAMLLQTASTLPKRPFPDAASQFPRWPDTQL